MNTNQTYVSYDKLKFSTNGLGIDQMTKPTNLELTT